MANCSTCGNKLAFFEAVKNLTGLKRCDQCNARYNQVSDYWLGLMQQMFNQGGNPIELEQSMYRNFQDIRMPPDLGQPAIQKLQQLCAMADTRRFNQIKEHWLKTIQQAFDQDGVPAELEQDILKNLRDVRMPPDIGRPVTERLRYLRELSEIRGVKVGPIPSRIFRSCVVCAISRKAIDCKSPLQGDDLDKKIGTSAMKIWCQPLFSS